MNHFDSRTRLNCRVFYFSYIILLVKYRNSDFLNDLYYKRQEFSELISKAKNTGTSILINTIRKLNNSRWARQINGDISIQDIFIEEFDNFLADNPDLEIRQSVIDNVEKMKKCGNFDYGYTFYECPNGSADKNLD